MMLMIVRSMLKGEMQETFNTYGCERLRGSGRDSSGSSSWILTSAKRQSKERESVARVSGESRGQVESVVSCLPDLREAKP